MLSIVLADADTPLAIWQRKLVSLVVTGASPPVTADVVTCSEQRWLDLLVGSPGLRLTQRIQRSWCLARAASVVSLTLSVVQDPRALLEAWIAVGGGRASFAESEAIALLSFIARRLDPSRHAFSVCMFERAVRLAQASQHSSMVRFWAAPEAVLRAAAMRDVMPTYEARPHWLVIDSQLPELWRHATESEIQSLPAAQDDTAGASSWSTAIDGWSTSAR